MPPSIRPNCPALAGPSSRPEPGRLLRHYETGRAPLVPRVGRRGVLPLERGSVDRAARTRHPHASARAALQHKGNCAPCLSSCPLARRCRYAAKLLRVNGACAPTPRACLRQMIGKWRNSVLCYPSVPSAPASPGTLLRQGGTQIPRRSRTRRESPRGPSPANAHVLRPCVSVDTAGRCSLTRQGRRICPKGSIELFPKVVRGRWWI